MNKPKIVWLDACPLIKDNLNIDALLALGEVTVYERTAPEQVLDRAAEAELIITNKVKFTEEHFRRLSKLRYIGETATGVDNIDVEAAKKYGITITNVPGYSTASVAQHVIALILAYTNGVEQHNESVHQNDWTESIDFSYWLRPIIELENNVLGLLGYGQVAKKVATIAKALGMQIIAHKPEPFVDDVALWVTWEDLLAQSDILSLHCPLTRETTKIINKNTLIQMKPTAMLINTGRGGLIDEEALSQALKNKQLSVACLDVLTQEPPSAANPLVNLKNCIITPHVAWASLAARKRLLNIICENIIHFLEQKPIHVVS